MHPAVTRHGRCLANIEFGLLDADESRRWAEEHGVPAENRKLLADLYAADLAPRQRPTTGFVVRT
jgi:hypothetical protein